jgi:FdhD protein
MVIKTVQMGVPILVSHSGFTAWGVELVKQANLTLVGCAEGRRFVALAGPLDPFFNTNRPEDLEEAAGYP